MLSSLQQQLGRTLRAIADVPDEQLADALAIFRPLRLKKDELFVGAGDVPTHLGFLASGLLRMYYLSEDGVEYTKSFCLENTFVAAYSALLLAEASRMSIQALEDSTLLVAGYHEYQALAGRHCCWHVVNMRIAQFLFIKKERRESELLLDDAQTRYLTFLAEHPGLEPRLKQHQIAAYLGITPVSLSRIRARLKASARAGAADQGSGVGD